MWISDFCLFAPHVSMKSLFPQFSFLWRYLHFFITAECNFNGIIKCKWESYSCKVGFEDALSGFDSQKHFITAVANDFSKPNFLVICFVSAVYEINICILISNPATLLNFITVLIICLHTFLCGFNMDDHNIYKKKVTLIIFNLFAINTMT